MRNESSIKFHLLDSHFIENIRAEVGSTHWASVRLLTLALMIQPDFHAIYVEIVAALHFAERQILVFKNFFLTNRAHCLLLKLLAKYV